MASSVSFVQWQTYPEYFHDRAIYAGTEPETELKGGKASCDLNEGG
jgi:hypothetical protein